MGYFIPRVRKIAWEKLLHHGQRFIDAWKLLELEGRCDTVGGMQFKRICDEFFAAGFPENVSQFIIEKANEPDPRRNDRP